MTVDIIYGERVTQGVDADATGGELWLKPGDLERVSGWTHEVRGFCRDEVCVPVPPARKTEFVRERSCNLAALAGLLGQPMVVDAKNHACCFGESPDVRKRALTSLDAPDFSLPDLDGEMHSLSHYRDKKVFLVSWASW